MINWSVVGQAISLFFIVTAGPAIVVFLSLRKGNL
uniref:Photosystem II reaction center protein Psb30 n=1 Tax=Haptophyceae sp. NIES-3900 TaxID=2748608 RepID=A0A7R7AIE3_9EUKA|nr:conserved protein [Haptophyceae sp. NIES-3900]